MAATEAVSFALIDGLAALRRPRMMSPMRNCLPRHPNRPSQTRFRCAYTRVRTQLDPPDGGGGEKNGGQVISGELVVACGDAPEILEPGEHALDEISLAIGFSVMRNERFSPSAGRDDSFNAALLEDSSEAVGVVGLVGDQSFDWAGGRQQVFRHHDVMDIAWGNQQNPGPADGVGEGVDRRRASAARASYAFRKGPPFPPAAERCALTCELSIEAVPITPVLPVTALNMASQTPWRLHQLKRL
jgi:hypothetical protein